MSTKSSKPGPGSPGRGPAPAPAEGMPLRRLASIGILGLVAALFAIAAVARWFGPAAPPPAVEQAKTKTETVADGMQRVIVTLKDIPAGEASKARIAEAQDQLLKALGSKGVRVERRYDLLPQLTLTVNDAVMALLKTHPLVATVHKDEVSHPLEGTKTPSK